jgi:hypothetical protein
MAIMAEAKGGDFVQAPVGSHAARCYQIIDLGHQKNEFEGDVKIQHQVLVSWELPNLDKLDDGSPMSISKFYTLSLHDKANLGKDLVSWRGKAFTEEEKAGFDITKLVGVQCMLSIVDKAGKSRVGSVVGVPQGMTVPPAINQPVIFEMAAYRGGDTVVFDSLSEGLQGLILKSEDLKTDSPEPQSQPVIEEGFDDDIPF